jgi:peptidoglycan/LPS O-acetylase OafA/YrhL
MENIFILQNWLNPELTWNHPSWSISAEFVTYAIFGLSCLFFKNQKKYYAFTAFLIFVSGYILSRNGMLPDNISGPARCLYAFNMGVLISVIFKKFELEQKISSSVPGALGLIATIGFMSIAPEKRGDNYLMLFPIIFSSFILIIAASSGKTYLVNILTRKLLIHLGTLSFGIYMIHSAVWRVIYLISKYFSADSQGSYTGKTPGLIFENAILGDLAYIATGLIVTIALAHLSYYKLEKPFLTKAQAAPNMAKNV